MKSNGQPPGDEKKEQSNIEETTTVLIHIVRALVDFPEEVIVRPIRGIQMVVFEVTVAAIDIKRVIGRKGRTADATRQLLTNIGAKVRLRYILEIIEPTFRVHEIPLIPQPKGNNKALK